LEEGSEREGLPILNGDQTIPITRPPCLDDDSVCPKGKPGQSDFTPETLEIFQYWCLCRSLDDHPDDLWYKRWKRILDEIVEDVKKERLERHREEARMRREMEFNKRRQNM